MHELRQENYIEIFPGQLFHGYLNEESIYINDNSFSLIVPAIRNGFKCYTGFGRFEIEKNHWYSILKELSKLMSIIDSKDRQKLKTYISIFFLQESICEWQLEQYKKIGVLKLLRFIEELIEWIETELEENEIITLIGL